MITDLHVIGVDPGNTTGWCLITVPYRSIFGSEPGSISDWDYGEITKDDISTTIEICRIAREVQGLAYRTGPAVVVEDWDIDPRFKSTDPAVLSPVRIGAMLRYAQATGKMDDARVVLQGRTIAKTTMTDERLRANGMYVAGSDHIRDATRHAITALRRAKANPEWRAACWRESY